MCVLLTLFARQVTPVVHDEGISYLYVQYSNLYLVAVARDNINAASILLFLHKLREVFVHYFNELEEESLRDNFVIAYELLDEVLCLVGCISTQTAVGWVLKVSKAEPTGCR